jgi:hypothetical protein
MVRCFREAGDLIIVRVPSWIVNLATVHQRFSYFLAAARSFILRIFSRA